MATMATIVKGAILASQILLPFCFTVLMIVVERLYVQQCVRWPDGDSQPQYFFYGVIYIPWSLVSFYIASITYSAIYYVYYSTKDISVQPSILLFTITYLPLMFLVATALFLWARQISQLPHPNCFI
jgi:hypothetical protein